MIASGVMLGEDMIQRGRCAGRQRVVAVVSCFRQRAAGLWAGTLLGHDRRDKARRTDSEKLAQLPLRRIG